MRVREFMNNFRKGSIGLFELGSGSESRDEGTQKRDEGRLFVRKSYISRIDKGKWGRGDKEKKFRMSNF